MTKEIKVIQCPKCGSTRKVELKPDYFKCQNCDTEYFLDNDDININHNYNYKPYSQPVPASPSKTVGIIIGVVPLVFVLGFLLPQLFNKSSPSASNATNKTNTYRWNNKDAVAYENTGGKLIIAIMGQRQFDDDEHDERSGNYIAFYNASDGKGLKAQRVNQFGKKLTKIAFRIFTNGDIYAIANESRLFKIDKTNTSLQEVSPNIFTHHQELEAGIANIEFISKDWGDGFKLMTNDGKDRSFFPIQDSVYIDKTKYSAENALAIRDARVKQKIYFLFSEKSDDFPDEKIKLIMYKQKDNLGGPNDRPFFQKGEFNDYNGIKRVTDFRQGGSLVISYKDLTPGRLYFGAKILYGDEKYVLISFNATAAEKANTSIQCLSIPDGRIIFTLPFTEEKYFDEEAIRYKGGFVVKTYESMYVIGINGKLINEFKMQ